MRRIWLVFSQAVTVAVATVFVLATFKPEWLSRSPSSGLPVIVMGTATPGVSATGSAIGFAAAARRAAPSVVSVATSSGMKQSQSGDPWFRRFEQQESDELAAGMGSAVIVSSDGYLLTNNHVVEGAHEIHVMLSDGRQHTARVVGTDPDTDLAVLKLDLQNLPAIAFAQVDALQVGDAVLAIGNPFNVGQTVTSGIVSAVGRTGLGLNTFENFIQTDAAINPGNSGGALVDASGQLLGINTAIYSRSGGSLGIGFAIPVSTARQVMEGLIRDGEVTRGWIGVQPTDLSPDMIESFKLKVDHGVLIAGVLRSGPASEAGMQPGDVVMAVAGQDVGSTSQLLNAVAALKPKTSAVIRVQRGEKALDVTVKVAQRPRQRVVEEEPETRGAPGR